MQIVNTAILKHPLNWLTVGLMLIVAAMAGTLILQYSGAEPSTATK